jgi:hypothetical protein
LLPLAAARPIILLGSSFNKQHFRAKIANDPLLIAAMNNWRANQNPPLPPQRAILALLQKALVAEGY